MASKTIRRVLSEMLEDLSAQNFDKFCRQLLDRKEEPRVRRNKVEGKNFLDIADVLVSTFTEFKAPQVALDILREIGCNDDAERLAEDVKVAGGSSAKPGPSETVGLSVGPTGEKTTKENSCTGKHFVDKHKVELIKRVTNIAPILDELWDNDVIQAEVYDKIRALTTCQEKIRALYTGPLRASEACKDEFYRILESNEPYLVSDLKKNN